MTNYREILRLHSLGLNKTEIASSCQCARNTVAATLQRAANCGLQWPLPEEMSDKQLSERLFPTSPSKPVYKMPDYAYVHKELQRSGVTLNLLWLEYCDQCRAAGEIPYQSTQFNKYYADYLAKVNATMHLNHKPGAVMQVDWAGDTATVIDTDILPQSKRQTSPRIKGRHLKEDCCSPRWRSFIYEAYSILLGHLREAAFQPMLQMLASPVSCSQFLQA